ncbi:DUF2478 domain-containing protein [Billgrantia endophytica]|uniref:Molybdenum ABC transporter ATP-binding protein n=1 Tax=Billgrantia endophytica TaxID=2033802 RepID=A0A2N7U741_9GAMM|nr:DUF2478 domain-containing protein [Halomonas endophytica]PMR76231.1 hypothetical protein C1H69_07635 [Halomonas endophytica]
MQTPFPAAAIVHDGNGQGADALLAEFARTLQANGQRVAGLITALDEHGVRCHPMQLIDVTSNTRYPIGQDLGPHSHACSLDPSGLVAASGVLREALHAAPQLVVINRFGAQEAAGRGFSTEMLVLMVKGIPLLTVVSHRHLTAWRELSGGLAIGLPPALPVLQRWHERLCPTSRVRTEP